MKHWTYLFIAAVLEIGWAVGFKYSQGFTRLVPSVITLAAMGTSMYLLALSTKVLPIGTAYAVWTGIGAAGTAVFGMILFKEPATVARIVCIGLIVAGVMGLKIFSGPTASV
jgi:quaternary ammonium compound-resistance protein SugE